MMAQFWLKSTSCKSNIVPVIFTSTVEHTTVLTVSADYDNRSVMIHKTAAMPSHQKQHVVRVEHILELLPYTNFMHT